MNSVSPNGLSPGSFILELHPAFIADFTSQEAHPVYNLGTGCLFTQTQENQSKPHGIKSKVYDRI